MYQFGGKISGRSSYRKHRIFLLLLIGKIPGLSTEQFMMTCNFDLKERQSYVHCTLGVQMLGTRLLEF